MVFPFILGFFPFSYKKVRSRKKGVDQLSQLPITVTQKAAACTYEHNYETCHLFEV